MGAKKSGKIKPKKIAEHLESLPKDLDPKHGRVIAEACLDYLLGHPRLVSKRRAEKLQRKIGSSKS